MQRIIHSRVIAPGPPGEGMDPGQVAAAAAAAVEDQAQRVHSVDETAFEWWILPTATYLQTPYPRTVFGGIASNGDIRVVEIDHATSRQRSYVIGTAFADDHNPPALWMGDNRRGIAIWTNHNLDSNWQYKIGSRSGDIASFAQGEQQQIAFGGTTTYTQIHRISHLSDDEQDTFYIFGRGNGQSWQVKSLSIDQASGAATWGRTQRVVNTPWQFYVSTADAYASGNQVIRFAGASHPGNTNRGRQLWYWELDVVTGEITSPFDPTFSENLSTGTGSVPVINLFDPLDPGNPTPTRPYMQPIFEEAVSETTGLQMYAVRPGPDTPAIAYSEYTFGDTENGRYKLVSFRSDGERGALLPGPSPFGVASTPAHASLDSGGFDITTIVRVPTIDEFEVQTTSPAEIASRIVVSSPLNGWFLRVFHINSYGNVQIRSEESWGNGASRNAHVYNINPTDSAALWGNDLGIRWRLDGAAGTSEMWYTLDPFAAEPTWVGPNIDSLGVTGISAFDGADQPLLLGGIPSAVVRYRSIYQFIMRDLSGNLIAGVDWLGNEWPETDSTFTDDAGRLWSLAGGAAIRNSFLIRDLGRSGGTFGYNPDFGYFGGVGFANPSYDQRLLIAREENGESIVEVRYIDGANVLTEVLESQPSTEGRLYRPYAPLYGGPLRALFCDEGDYGYHGESSFQDLGEVTKGR